MINNFINQVYFSNRALDYMLFAGLFVFGVMIVRFLERLVFNRLRQLTSKTKSNIDDFLLTTIEKKLAPLIYYAVFYFSIKLLTVSTDLEKGIRVVSVFYVTYFGVKFALSVIVFALETYWVKKEKDEAKKGALKGIITVIQVLIWGLALVILLDNLGIEISALLAGLGIGGIAIALAAQAVLGDVFSYFTIFFDRPFEIGDFIIVGDYMGNVEFVGIKTTRIRSLNGEQIVFSNTDLTDSRVRNYKRMKKRRILFKLGVVYDTPVAKLKKIPGMLQKIVEGVEKATFDRAHFQSYGDFSLNFEIVYFVLSGDYNTYMDIQQEINFEIAEVFSKAGIEFAYPTQTLFLNKVSSGSN